MKNLNKKSIQTFLLILFVENIVLVMAVGGPWLKDNGFPLLIRQTLIYMVPLMVVALAGVFAERSGVINLALEGIMIIGAFAGVMFVRAIQDAGWFNEAYENYSALIKAMNKVKRPEMDEAMMQTLAAGKSGFWQLQGFAVLAMLVAGVVGGVFSLLLAFAAINLKADQTISGTALNLLAPALVLFLIMNITNQSTMGMANGNDAAAWFMLKKGYFGIWKNDPVNFFQSAFLDMVFPVTYLFILIFIIFSIILYKTRFGLRMRSCGENPQASASLGINVVGKRYAGTVISGVLAGMGGFLYALTTVGCTTNGDVAGFGFLALAVMIFGNWKPVPIAMAALLFGLFKCISATYTSLFPNENGVGFFNTLGVPEAVYRMLPYAVTLIVLMFTSKRSRAPKAEGIPYDKSLR